MLEKKLEKARGTRKELVHKLIFFSIVTLITFICSILFFVLSYHFISEDISWFYLLLSLISILLCIVVFISVISYIIELSDIKDEINTILFKQSLPTKFCYDVTLKTNTLNDIYLKYNVKKLRIRYVESRDCIEYKYTLDGKKHHYFVTVDFAKQIFECEFLNF
ncbi:MAG: hypothetical protein J6A04_05910 [Clostridia bacterium]|nr:hypothetical protein [Clostridia bacterium]